MFEIKSEEKCPICDSPLLKSSSNGPVGLEEEHYRCDNCKMYSYSYEYGNTSYEIYNVRLQSSYHDSVLQIAKDQKIVDILSSYYKRKYFKEKCRLKVIRRL
jgi:hypothetical protein